MLPLVTIAIPTYNRADSYLPKALRSALNQTYPNLEIIVSDNCSTDYTKAVVTSINDPRLRYFRHEPNIGANANFNFCIDQAKGNYLLLLHDDDMIDHNFVACCMRAAGGLPEVGIIRTGVRLIDEKGKVISETLNRAGGLNTAECFRAWFSARSPIYACNTLFNTKKLRAIGGLHSRHNCYQDIIAVLRLAANYGRLDVAAVKASFRRHRGEMIVQRRISEWCEDSLELLDLMCNLVSEKKDEVYMEGARFLSRANYGRATRARTPLERLAAVIEVFRYFKCRQPPSFNHLLSIFDGTRLYQTLRHVKRNWPHVLSRA